MDPTPILPIRGATVELIFTAPTRLRFFHQPLVTSLVRGLMGGERDGKRQGETLSGEDQGDERE